jgi:hypothetical protein
MEATAARRIHQARRLAARGQRLALTGAIRIGRGV